MENIVDDKQCTILWHVDDLKTSHVDPAVIYSVLAGINAEYGKITKMTIMRGKVHKYLGINIDYSSPGKLISLMIDYIVKMIDDIPEYMKGLPATPDAQHLLTLQKIQPSCPRPTQIFFII